MALNVLKNENLPLMNFLNTVRAVLYIHTIVFEDIL